MKHVLPAALVAVLITGCSTGLGRLTVETLAPTGATVYAAMRDVRGRNAEPAAALSKIARVIEMDVTDQHSVQAAVECERIGAHRCPR